MLLLLLSSRESVSGAQEKTMAPAFSLQDGTGGSVGLETFRGKVVLINFWAVWCGACKEELPGLETLLRKHGNEGFAVISIAVDSPEQAVSRLQGSMQLSFPVLLDDGAASAAYRCVHLPTSFLVGRDGVIRFVHKGFSRDSIAVYEKEIVELLNKH